MKGIVGVIAVLGFVACSSGTKKNPEATAGDALPTLPAVQSVEKVGNLETVRQFGDLYISGEPNEAALLALKKKGVALVVDLRGADELKGKSPEKTLKKAGLKYANVPVKKGELPDEAAMQAINKLLMENPGGVLLHCSTGNRGATYLGLDLVKNKGVPANDALRISKEMGLNSPAQIQKLEKAVKGQ